MGPTDGQKLRSSIAGDVLERSKCSGGLAAMTVSRSDPISRISEAWTQCRTVVAAAEAHRSRRDMQCQVRGIPDHNRSQGVVGLATRNAEQVVGLPCSGEDATHHRVANQRFIRVLSRNTRGAKELKETSWRATMVRGMACAARAQWRTNSDVLQSSVGCGPDCGSGW